MQSNHSTNSRALQQQQQRSQSIQKEDKQMLPEINLQQSSHIPDDIEVPYPEDKKPQTLADILA